MAKKTKKLKENPKKEKKEKKEKKSKKSQQKEKKPKKEKKEKKEIKIRNVNLNLRVASKRDFLEVDVIKSDKTKTWKTTDRAYYWLINTKNEVENDPYILDENTDMNDFGIYLSNEQVLIPIKRFDQ